MRGIHSRGEQQTQVGRQQVCRSSGGKGAGVVGRAAGEGGSRSRGERCEGQVSKTAAPRGVGSRGKVRVVQEM